MPRLLGSDADCSLLPEALHPLHSLAPVSPCYSQIPRVHDEEVPHCSSFAQSPLGRCFTFLISPRTSLEVSLFVGLAGS